MEKREAGILKTTIVLMIISAAVAALIATVNYFTAPKIRENGENDKKNAILEIFPEATSYVTHEGEIEAENVEAVYLAYNGEELCGYVVNACPVGFGGEIKLMVGITPQKTVKMTKILSFSETAGVGTKVNADSFLNHFNGGSGTLAYGEGYNAITGATISSNTVIKGINASLSAVAEIG